ncbi:MAG TPA: winged helix-turn-helix domain-containing protein [Telluria sp.]
MEPRAMDVLMALCQKANTVLSTEQLLEQCWGSTLNGENQLHKVIGQLRQVLGDNVAAGEYIQTIRKRGYRTVAPVEWLAEPPPLVRRAWHGDSPFRGLQAFQEEHAAVFFGRADATAQLKQALLAQAANGLALMLVLGPSAAGKTSLVRAGLLPALAGPQAHGWSVASAMTMDLGEIGELGLLDALGSVILDWHTDGHPVFAGASAVGLAARMAADAGAVVDELTRALAAAHGSGASRCALFIDRFEALFALPHIDDAARRQFISVVETFARSASVLVIIGCRNDFYPRIAEYPFLMATKSTGGHFDLGRPSHAEVAQIIRLPALAANLRFGIDPGSQARLDDILCDSALHGQDALPLLQYTLQELYRLRTPEGELTFEAFQRLGGIEGVIGLRAEEMIGAMDQAVQDAVPRVLSLVVTLSANEDSVTSRRAPWTALLSSAERALVNTLVEARLFVSELVAGEPGFGIAHEAILRRWPRAVEWIGAHRSALLIRARIHTLAGRWAAEGRANDLLIPAGKQLDEALGLLGASAFSLSPDERALVQASQARARRGARLGYATFGLVLCLALLAGLAALSAMNSRAAEQQRRADAEGLIGFMLGDLANKLRPLARLDLLDDIGVRAIEYLSLPRSDELSAVSLAHQTKALQTISEVRIARGDPNGALAALQSARDITTRQLLISPSDPVVLTNAGANAFFIGQLHLNQNKWSKAAEMFGAYRDLSDRLAAVRPDDPDAWMEQSYAHSNLGTLAIMRGKTREAEAAFARSLVLKTRALSARPHDRGLASYLADSLSWTATAKEELGELDAARALYEQELALVEPLHRRYPKDALWTHAYARALQHRAELNQHMGRDQLALADFALAKGLYGAAIDAEPNNRMWQAHLVSLLLGEQRLLTARSEPRARFAELDAVAGRIGTLTRLDPGNAEWSRLEAMALLRAVQARIAVGEGTAALGMLEQAESLAAGIYAKNDADVRARVIVAEAALTRAQVDDAGGDRAAARRSCDKAIEVLGSDAAASNNFRLLNPLIRARLCLGEQENAIASISVLEKMAYKEANFQKFLSTYSTKGK